MIPHRTPFFLPLIYPSLIWRIQTDRKELFLTFDDGPVDGPTDFVLEELNKASAKATFFCIGDNIQKHPETFKKMVASGHKVGNHTFNHLNGWKTKTKDYVRNIKLLESHLPAVDCLLPTLMFRPPYGRITLSQIRALNNYKIIMWDVLSRDYDKNLSSESCLRNTIHAIRSGSIIVFHDSFRAEKNMQFVLPRLLSYFADKGYSFQSLTL